MSAPFCPDIRYSLCCQIFEKCCRVRLFFSLFLRGWRAIHSQTQSVKKSRVTCCDVSSCRYVLLTFQITAGESHLCYGWLALCVCAWTTRSRALLRILQRYFMRENLYAMPVWGLTLSESCTLIQCLSHALAYNSAVQYSCAYIVH